MVIAVKQHVDVEVFLQPQCTDEDAGKAAKWVLETLQQQDGWYYASPCNPLLRIAPCMERKIHSIYRCDMQDTTCALLACQVCLLRRFVTGSIFSYTLHTTYL